MKRIILIMLVALMYTLQGNAQNIADHAIGVRFGDVKGFGAEVNYQLGLNERNRLEFGLSQHGSKKTDILKLVGLYEWVWNIDGGLNWYAGPGIGVGLTVFDDKAFNDRTPETFFLAAGVTGLEYRFNIPLLVSFDIRPEANFGNARDDVSFDIGIAARYVF